MKGFNEEGSEDIEATKPVAKRRHAHGHRWKLGFLDFTQAYATPPREGIPGDFKKFLTNQLAYQQSLALADPCIYNKRKNSH